MTVRRQQRPALFASCWLAVPMIMTLLSLFVRGADPAADPSALSFRPNVLVLFSDDQRADTVAALGNPHIRTPNLDKLLRDWQGRPDDPQPRVVVSHMRSD